MEDIRQEFGEIHKQIKAFEEDLDDYGQDKPPPGIWGKAMSNLREAGSGWHFDKTIPVVTILGFVAQLALVAYWVGGQSQRLDQIEVSQQINSKAVQKVDKIEVKMEGMMRILERLERKIDE